MNGNELKAGEFRGMVIERLDSIKRDQAEIRGEINNGFIRLDSRIDDHESYHRCNEHKWGFWKLLKKWPIIAVFIGGLIMAAGLYLGLNWKDVLKAMLAGVQ